MFENSWVDNPHLRNITEGTDRGGWKTLKTISSHVGKSKEWSGVIDWDNPVGYVASPASVPSPYSFSASRTVYKWNGKNCIEMETSHKKYEVIEVPSSAKIHSSEDAAEKEYTAARRKD